MSDSSIHPLARRTFVGGGLGLVLALADSDTRVAAIPLADGALLELRGAF